MRALLLLLALAAPSLADLTRPVYLGLTEVRDGRFEVVWRVPRRGDRVLAVAVRLPDVFREATPPTVMLDESVQETRWTVEAKPWELSRAPIAIDGPGRSRVDVMVRFEFRDGAVVVRVLPPESTECRFPDRAAARDPARVIQGDVRAGAGYAAVNLPILAFAVALALFGSARVVASALAFFLVGQLCGIALGLPVPPPMAHALLATAAAVTAAAAMQSRSRGLGVVALACGLAHGSVLPGGALGALGADAVALIASLTVLAVLPKRWKVGMAYALGVGSVALALIEATAAGPAAPEAPQSNVLLAPAARSPEAPASSRVAAATDAPVQLFVEVTPFETRVECVAKVAALGVGDGKDVEVSAQDALKRAAQEVFGRHVAVLLDANRATATDIRIDFVTRDVGGVLERVEPVVEKFDEALVGIALSYPTSTPPGKLTVRWQPLAGVAVVPAVIVDPVTTRTVAFDATTTELRWSDVLSLPPVRAVEVRERVANVSLVSMALLLLGAWAAVRRFNRGGIVAARVLLAGACFVAPYVTVPIPLPGGGTPNEKQATDVAEALLTNIYRSLEQPDESTAYDRLRVSVTEEALRPIYLEQRRMLELGRRGGARARVDSVEIARVHSIEPAEDGRVRATVEWEAGGFVVHYGHRHFRQNRYEAAVELVVEEGGWKFGRLAVLDKQRLR